MLDRVTQPSFGKIDAIELQEPKVFHLSNGLAVFCIDAGEQEVLKVELIFGAGTATADKLLVGSSAVNLIKEGTSNRTAAEIAESVDFYGAYLQSDVIHEESALSLITLNKHLKSTLPTLGEVYADAAFPEREFETYVLKHQQELMVNQEKVSYLCSKVFNAALYGESHPYGRSAEIESYNELTRDDLVAFHSNHVKGRIKYILVSGKMREDTIELLEKQFGSDQRLEAQNVEVTFEEAKTKSVHIEKEDAVQNAIRVGRILFNRNHPDYIGMQILATVLGGYFGSRLMSNIREDKGYTYGVGAGLVSLQNSGYLTISTEVGADVCDAAVNEIFFEIERLRKELIPVAELDLVRNYMLGSILKTVDGPFNIGAKWRAYLKYNLSVDEHHKLVQRIKTITAERLRELAQQYLQRDDLNLVTAGKGN